jgi:hypothetical protein
LKQHNYTQPLSKSHLAELHHFNHRLHALVPAELQHLHHVCAPTHDAACHGLLAKHDVLQVEVNDSTTARDAALQDNTANVRGVPRVTSLSKAMPRHGMVPNSTFLQAFLSQNI